MHHFQILVAQIFEVIIIGIFSKIRHTKKNTRVISRLFIPNETIVK